MTLKEEIACISRELALRQRLYPRFIETKRISKAKAEHEIAAMKSVLDRLMRILDTEA